MKGRLPVNPCATVYATNQSIQLPVSLLQHRELFSSLIESVEHNRVFKYWENNQLKQVVRETSRMTGSRPSAQWDTQPGHALFLKATYRLQEDYRIWGAGEKLFLDYKTLQRNTSTGKGGCLWGTGTDDLWGWDETPEQASRDGQVAGLVSLEICPRRLFQVEAFAWTCGSVSLWALSPVELGWTADWSISTSTPPRAVWMDQEAGEKPCLSAGKCRNP